MESKKINQLATKMSPEGSDLTIIGDPITGVSRKITLIQLAGTIGAGADLQQVTDNGATTTNPIAIGGLTITGLATGVLKSDSGIISSVPFGAANGVATLGGDGKVPSNQLPSYVDDVVEVANFAALPAIGETGKIYITLDNNKVYRWTGSTYVEIAANNAVWGAITGTLSNQTDLQSALNAKQNAITLTTTGTSGVSTLVGSTLNIPNYSTDLSGYVPYTGATANVDLGTFDLTTDIINLNQLKAIGSGGINIYSNSGTHIALMGGGGGAGTTLYGGLIGTSASFTTSGGSDTFAINHSSGSGIALNITKGGNGEGLYINKTSGSGNAATIIGTLNATTLVKSGGTSSQFLKADGSVDSSAYITLASLSAGAGITYNNTTGVITSTITQYTDALARAAISLTTTGTSGAATYNSTTGVLNVPNYAPDLSGYVPTSRTITINGTSFDLSANRSYSVGTVTSVGLSSATSGVTIGSTPITTSGTITLAIATASGSQNGLLSSTDWTTFNNKQSALTNPVTGTGTINTLAKFTGTSTIGDSSIIDNGTSVFIGSGFKQVTITYPSTFSTKLGIGDSNFYIQTDASPETFTFVNASSTGDFLFKSGTSSTPKFTLTGTGNLGLGVTPSAWNSVFKVLESGDTNNQTAIAFQNNSNVIYLTTNSYFDTSWKYKFSDNAGQYLIDGNEHRWYNAPSGTAGNAITFTQAMTLFSTGNLAVGTTTDAGYKLDVNGTGRFSNNLFVEDNKIFGLRPSTTEYSIQYRDLDFRLIGSSDSGTQRLFSFGYYTSNNIAGTWNSKATINSFTGAATFSGFVSVLSTSYDSGAEGLKLGYDSSYYNAISATFSSAAASNKMNFVVSSGNGTRGIAMTLQGNGNVGIGTSSPSEKLVVSNTTGTVLEVQATSTGGDTRLRLNPVNNNNYSLYVNGSTDALQFMRNSSELMRITSGGNVGIGTNNPSSLLTVNGTSTSSETAQIRIIKSGANEQTLHIGYNTTSDYAYLNAYKAGIGYKPISLNPDGGNTLIGTTTDSGQKLQVDGAGRFFGVAQPLILESTGNNELVIRRANTSNGAGLGLYTNSTHNWLLGTAWGENSSNFIIYNAATGTQSFKIDYSSNAATFSSSVTATSFFESSDSRLKILVKDYEQPKGIENVVARMYVKNNKQELGYYAQDLQEILPSAVTEGDDGFLSLSYSQVHTAKIAHLEAEVAELKELIKKLL
jgi:hypothetical protein